MVSAKGYYLGEATEIEKRNREIDICEKQLIKEARQKLEDKYRPMDNKLVEKREELNRLKDKIWNTNNEEERNNLMNELEVKKKYLAVIKGKITKKKVASLEAGIILNGRKTWPATIEIIEASSKSSKINIIIHEGRKRQVRRMFAAVGHPVIHLKRLAYGNLHIGNLAVGKYRFLRKNDLEKLF